MNIFKYFRNKDKLLLKSLTKPHYYLWFLQAHLKIYWYDTACDNDILYPTFYILSNVFAKADPHLEIENSISFFSRCDDFITSNHKKRHRTKVYCNGKVERDSISAQCITHKICSAATAHKMKLSYKDFFSKCDQIHRSKMVKRIPTNEEFA